MKLRTDLSPKELNEVIEAVATELGILDAYIPPVLQLKKGDSRRDIKAMKYDSQLLEELQNEFIDRVRRVVKRWQSKVLSR